MKSKSVFSLPCPRAVLFVIFIALFLTACSPALYKRPAQDFQVASATLKDAYFLEWEIANQAQIERGDLEDQVKIWTSPPGITATHLDKVSKRMSARRQEDIHEELRPLRLQAFAVLEGYAATLVSLSSDEPTEQIKLQLNGLVTDISKTLESAAKLQLVGDTVGKLKKYAGPLQQYIGILNEIIGIVSNVIRERAIIDTIGKSNESILSLIDILKEEAEYAQENALKQTTAARENINDYMSHDKFLQADNNTKADVVKRKAQLETMEKRLGNQDIGTIFKSAAKAQNALVKKAMLKDPGDWALRIKQFREQVTATKTAIEKIKSEM